MNVVEGVQRTDRPLRIPVQPCPGAPEPEGALKRELAVRGVDRLAEPGHHVAEIGEGAGFSVQPCPSARRHPSRTSVDAPRSSADRRLRRRSCRRYPIMLSSGRSTPSRKSITPPMVGPLVGCSGLPVAVAGQGEEIAVGAPALAERAGKVLQRAESVARAQQDLGGSNRSRRENHDLSDDLALAASQARPDVEVVHAPRAVRSLLDMGDHRQRPDLGALLFRLGEVVLVERVLCAAVRSRSRSCRNARTCRRAYTSGSRQGSPPVSAAVSSKVTASGSGRIACRRPDLSRGPIQHRHSRVELSPRNLLRFQYFGRPCSSSRCISSAVICDGQPLRKTRSGASTHTLA